MPPQPLRRRAPEARGLSTQPTRRIYEMLACFEAGDYLGALSVSDDVLGTRSIVSRGLARRPAIPVSTRAAYVLSLVEENGTLEELVYATGLPMIDALRAVCELVEIGHLRVDTAPEAAPSHIRVTG